MLAAAADAETRGWEFGKQREQAANKELAANGVTLHEPDAAMKAAYRKVGDTMLAEWLKSAGADGRGDHQGLSRQVTACPSRKPSPARPASSAVHHGL